MQLRPIRSKHDYRAALLEVERLWDAPDKSAEADRLEVLPLLIEDYERKHFPIEAPDPIDFLLPEKRQLTACPHLERLADTAIGGSASLR